MITLIIFLVILFIAKHAVADYYLQCIYSNLSTLKRKEGSAGIFALLAHATDHAILTFVILLLVWFSGFPFFAFLGLLDLVSHFVIDALKIKIEFLFKSIFGRIFLMLVDQGLHSLTYFYIITYIVKHS